jgi:hypothetical protein
MADEAKYFAWGDMQGEIIDCDFIAITFRKVLDS